ncbi:hypothetical protein Y032_0218g2422 [Ancylostoma ceylanicum]|nr:hypothetical protein Y032_0218g2422 [Ancylostoma ceylanicum]
MLQGRDSWRQWPFVMRVLPYAVFNADFKPVISCEVLHLSSEYQVPLELGVNKGLASVRQIRTPYSELSSYVRIVLKVSDWLTH